MTYLALQTKVQQQSGNRSSSLLAQIKDYLNYGQNEVAGAFDNWPELQSSSTINVVSGTEAYSLDSDFSKMRKVYISSPTNDETVLEEINYQQFRNLYQNTSNDSTDTPRYWYFDPTDNTKIRIFPLSDGNYTVTYDYIANPTDMGSDSSSPFFDSRYHHILIDYALAMVYESSTQRNYRAANYHNTKFRNGLSDLISAANKQVLSNRRIAYGSGVNEGGSTRFDYD